MAKLSIVKTFSSRTEAEIAKSYLASFGIKTYIFSDDAGQMYASLQGVRGVKLMANKNDLPEALELIKDKDLSNE